MTWDEKKGIVEMYVRDYLEFKEATSTIICGTQLFSYLTHLENCGHIMVGLIEKYKDLYQYTTCEYVFIDTRFLVLEALNDDDVLDIAKNDKAFKEYYKDEAIEPIEF